MRTDRFALKFLFTVLLSAVIVLVTIVLHSSSNSHEHGHDSRRIRVANKNVPSRIPKVLVSTYHTKSKIPYKVFANISMYASDYEYKIFDDDEIVQFLTTHYPAAVVETFHRLKLGAHKADLFRYCYLYKYGGVYIDIKTELIQRLDTLFHREDAELYTVLCDQEDFNGIYQGIIASVARNPIFKDLIDFMVNIPKPVERYQAFTKDFQRQICNHYNTTVPTAGYTRNGPRSVYLFKENCSCNPDDCYDGLDRYGGCCHVYEGRRKIIKSRYSDYPW